MEALKSDSLVKSMCMFLRKNTSHCKDSSALGSGDPTTIYLATKFNWKMQVSSYYIYSSTFMLENIYDNFT